MVNAICVAKREDGEALRCAFAPDRCFERVFGFPVAIGGSALGDARHFQQIVLEIGEFDDLRVGFLMGTGNRTAPLRTANRQAPSMLSR